LGDSLAEVNFKEVGSSRHQKVSQEAGYEAVGMLLPSLLAQLQGDVIRLLLVLKKIQKINTVLYVYLHTVEDKVHTKFLL
jgi:hypothetical protein